MPKRTYVILRKFFLSSWLDSSECYWQKSQTPQLSLHSVDFDLTTVLSLLDTLTGISNWHKKGEISDLNFTDFQFSVLSWYVTVAFVSKGWLEVYKIFKEHIAEKAILWTVKVKWNTVQILSMGTPYLFFVHWGKGLVCGRDYGVHGKGFLT